MRGPRAGRIARFLALAIVIGVPAVTRAKPAPPLPVISLAPSFAASPQRAVSWSDLEKTHPEPTRRGSLSAVGFWLVGSGLASAAVGSAAAVPDNDEGLLAVGALTGAALVVSGLVLFFVGAARR